MDGCPHDRPMNDRRIAYLDSALREGQWRPPHWATAYCKADKKTYRVNGKHSSTVLSLANGHFPKGTGIIFEHYECDTLEDMAKLYASFDRRESARAREAAGVMGT